MVSAYPELLEDQSWSRATETVWRRSSVGKTGCAAMNRGRSEWESERRAFEPTSCNSPTRAKSDWSSDRPVVTWKWRSSSSKWSSRPSPVLERLDQTRNTRDWYCDTREVSNVRRRSNPPSWAVLDLNSTPHSNCTSDSLPATTDSAVR